MSALWSGWGADPFSEQVEKATSELLPAGQEDIALNLDICDQVRAKQVQPKQAMQVIKRRVSHKNPNVVLLALGLTDICIKNGGDHFLQEVASREFMDNLVSVLENPSGVNHDVKAKALGLIQSWAQIAEAKPDQMGYINEVYRTLRGDRFEFPPRDPHVVASTALVETLTAPEWVDDDVCLRCRTAFTTFTRKHHCRNCGNVFCQQCTSHSMSLPWFGIGQDVRVCDACHTRRAPLKNAAKLSRSSSSAATTVPSSRGGAATHQRSLTMGGKPRKGGRSSSKEDDDLALAIKLSLESSGAGASGSGSSDGPYQTPSAPGRATRQADGRMLEGTDADDDPDLAAAIAASLRDWAPPQPSAPDGVPWSQPREGYGGQLSGPAAATAAAAGMAPAGRESLNLPPSLELPPNDVDSLLTFAQTVQTQEVYNQRHGVTGAPPHQQAQAQALYERASAARPKMARSLEEGHRRHSVLVSMHEKLTEAVRLYDHLLDAQMMRPAAAAYAPYSQTQGAAYYGQDPRLQGRDGPMPQQQHHQQFPQQPASGMYPSMPPAGPSSSAAAPCHLQQQHGQPIYADAAAYQHPHAQQHQQHHPGQYGGVPSLSTTPQPHHQQPHQQQQPVYNDGNTYQQQAGGVSYNGMLAANQVGAQQQHHDHQHVHGQVPPQQQQQQQQHEAYHAGGYANPGDPVAAQQQQQYYAGSQTHTPQPGTTGARAPLSDTSYMQGQPAGQYGGGGEGYLQAGPSYLGGGPTAASGSDVAQAPNSEHVGLDKGTGELGHEQNRQQQHAQYQPHQPTRDSQQQPQISLNKGAVHINGYPGANSVSTQRRRSTDTLASSSTGWNNVPIEPVSPAAANGPSLVNGNGNQQPRQQQHPAASNASPSTSLKTTPQQYGQAPSSANYLPIFPIAPHPDNGLGPSASQTELVSPVSANTKGRSSAGMWQQPSAAHPQAVGESPLIEF